MGHPQFDQGPTLKPPMIRRSDTSNVLKWTNFASEKKVCPEDFKTHSQIHTPVIHDTLRTAIVPWPEFNDLTSGNLT